MIFYKGSKTNYMDGYKDLEVENKKRIKKGRKKKKV